MGMRRSFNTNVRLWMVLGPALFLAGLGLAVGIGAWMGYPRRGDAMPVLIATAFVLAGLLGVARWWQLFRAQQSSGGYRRRRRHH